MMPRVQSLALPLLHPECHAYGRVVRFDGSSQIIDRGEDRDGDPGCDRGVLDRGGAGAIAQKGQDFAHVKLNSVLNLASILGNKSCRVLNDFVQIESIGLASLASAGAVSPRRRPAVPAIGKPQVHISDAEPRSPS